ncbi:MBL fold metallo-hydrolase [Bacillus massilinigeriensis]|uniref:MBL fold metallo-hydrolase n=1 Tax=Bacillus massilionigeriensis TaxID=1805475 RepID=UPI00096AEBDA|nr:MBL fold metallo-hydrolase [Bacillus massilionigeriensis]
MIQFKNNDFTIFESQLFKTTSTVVQTDDCIIVIDPTWLPAEVKEIRQHVDQVKQNKRIYLLLTHSDWDHVLGCGAFPDATVIASEGLAEGKEKEQIIEQIKDFDDKYYIDRDYPISYPKVDIVVEDGQVLDIGQTSITFYLAKGHTDDGIFAIIEPLGIWIAGDYLSDVEFPFIYTSTRNYEETLKKTDRIQEIHKIHYLVPGHGHFTNSKEEIIKRKKDSLYYIEELKKTVHSNGDGSHLIKGYSYLRGMRACHDENINLIKSELGLG